MKITWFIWSLIWIHPCFCSVASAGESPVLLIYDAIQGGFVDSTGKDTQLETEIAAGSLITIEVRNINTIKFDVIINSALLKFEGKNTSRLEEDQQKTDINQIGLLMSQYADDVRVQIEERDSSSPDVKQLQTELAKRSIPNIVAELRNFLQIGNDLLSLVSAQMVVGDTVKGRARKILEPFFKDTIPSPSELRTKATDLWHRNRTIMDLLKDYFRKSGKVQLPAEELERRISQMEKFLLPVSLEEAVNRAGEFAVLFQRIIDSPFCAKRSLQATDEYDIVRFTVQLVSKEEEDPSPKDLVEFEMYVVKKWEIDFSAGLTLTTLVDESYRTVTHPPDDSMVVKKSFVQEDDSKVGYGMVGLVHLGYRFSSTVLVGAEIGTVAAANGNLANLQYVLGAGVVFGRYTRFSVNGGMSFGSVKRLGGGFLEGESNKYETGLTDAPTKDVTKLGWFVSVTYSIPSVTSGEPGGE